MTLKLESSRLLYSGGRMDLYEQLSEQAGASVS